MSQNALVDAGAPRFYCSPVWRVFAAGDPVLIPGLRDGRMPDQLHCKRRATRAPACLNIVLHVEFRLASRKRRILSAQPVADFIVGITNVAPSL